MLNQLIEELKEYPKTETFCTGVDVVVSTKSVEEHQKVITELKSKYGDEGMQVRVYPNTESIVHEGYIRSRLQWPNAKGEPAGLIKREC